MLRTILIRRSTMRKKLGPFEEYVGQLRDVAESDTGLIASFTDGNEILLPQDQTLFGQLRKMRGKKIGIIKIDDADGSYLFMKLENE